MVGVFHLCVCHHGLLLLQSTARQYYDAMSATQVIAGVGLWSGTTMGATMTTTTD